MRTIYAHCAFNLGDNIINFIFFYKIKQYIEENDIIVNYYCKEIYHENLNDFKCSENIILLPLKKKGTHLWQATVPKFMDGYIEDTLCKMFNDFLVKNDIPPLIEAFEYQDNDLLDRFSKMDDKYKNIDVLIVNSTPRSAQFKYDKNEFNEFIIKLGSIYKIAVTEKVNDEILSLDDLSVKNIAAIATGVNKIIAINTGPSIALYNTDILNKVDAIYILDTADYKFKTRKVKVINRINQLHFFFEKINENFQFLELKEPIWFHYMYILLILIGIVIIFMVFFRKIVKSIRRFLSK
jgi:hypothetical protein